MTSLFHDESTDAAAHHVKVAPEQGVDAAPDGLTYAVPEALGELAVGERVVVPLGRGNTRTPGYVVAHVPAQEAAKLKGKLKAVLERDPRGISLTPSLIQLARWIAGYYVCPLGMVFSTMLPAAVKKGVGTHEQTLLRLPPQKPTVSDRGPDDTPPPHKPTKLQRAILDAAKDAADTGSPWLERHALAERAGAKTMGPIKKLLAAGLLESRTRSTVLVDRDDPAMQKTAQKQRVTLNPAQRHAVETISQSLGKGFAPYLLHGITGSGKTEVYLRVIERFFNRDEGRRVIAEGVGPPPESSPGPPHSIDHVTGRRVIAQGVGPDPADGSTDPGQDAPRHDRASDAPPSVIVLVPEIALTPQTVGRFVGRFGAVAVMHSGLTAAQRHDQWRRIRRGEARIVVGARSAIFAPLDDVGLIIVDEEHEPGYKQDQLPRYHARDVAVRRGQLEGATVILGSATPSLESYYNATEPTRLADAAKPPASGSSNRPPYRLLTLPDRAPGLMLPRVEVVDLTEERRKRAEHEKRRGARGRGYHLLSLRLENELQKILDQRVASEQGRRVIAEGVGPPPESDQTGGSTDPGQDAPRHDPASTAHAPPSTLNAPPLNAPPPQAILLLNRRGYANYIACPDPKCGWLQQCDHCDAMMVFHKSVEGGASSVAGDSNGRSTLHSPPSTPHPGFLRCHHCETEQLLPQACPSCGKRVTVFGLGTQRVEEELARKFPDLRTIRMDADTMRGSARTYHDALESFRHGEVDVLLGTQMIAKGLDFPNVKLVGVISADTALHLPDFRAAERTFQLIAQVTGRAGRATGTQPGDTSGGDLAIVQTFNPHDPTITLACQHDYPGFATRELELRRPVSLPPVGRMARIVLRHTDQAKAHAAAEQLADRLAEHREQLGSPVKLRGPSPCPLSRLGDHFRLQVELLAPPPNAAASLQKLLTAARNAGHVRSDTHMAVDVDPTHLL